MEILGRRFKYEDGTFYIRAHNNLGVETKKEIWREVKFNDIVDYKRCNIKINKKQYGFLKHRLVYKFYNPDWDILDSSTSNHIDHINRDTYDNRIENLRLVTHQENMFNKKEARGFFKRNNRYETAIRANNKLIYLGLFKTEDEARQAYLEAKKKYHRFSS